jgi:protein involved in polysaccharide export with SLBB domain
VQRLNPQDLSSRLLPFNLGRALDDPSAADNLELEPGDVVTVFSQQDIEVPIEKRTKFVRIEGEIGAAGVYRVEPGETLRDLVARAGGLTRQAYLFAADFRRESAREQQEEKLQRMIEEMDKEVRSKAARAASSVNPEERQAWREELEAERAVIDKLRQTRPTGRIVLELRPSDDRADALPALPLEDGDRLTVPPRSATVEVVGAVYNQNAFLYRDGKSIRDYIARAGGATRDADSGRLFVIRADGSVVSKQMRRSFWTGSFESMRLMPGDTIVMPERIRTGSLLRGMRDWSQIFSQFALGAAAIRVISP